MASLHDQRVLALLLEEAHDLLDEDDVERAEATLREAESIDAGYPPLRTLRAQMAFDAGALDDALTHALAALEGEDLADAHHVAARVYEARGDAESRARHDLEVLRLDAASDLRFGAVTREDVDALEALAAQVLQSLPTDVAEAVGSIPVMLEARPHPGIVEDGFDPRAVGLFEGGPSFSDVIPDRPVRIVVFYANLLATCRDEAEVEEQLRITILHEIGHALGLDEDGVDALGLG
ncbi:MAG: metallopeptidase family protein [Nannocystaceae bacterium]|nr:metallopeptidase family protein [bacterium]